MPTSLTVVVADDHPLFRSGVVACLAKNPKLKLLAEASDGESCIAKLDIFNPDILIVDLSMPRISGLLVLEWVQENLPQTRVFILSMYTELEFVQKAKELGADGFLAKEDAQSELLTALEGEPGVFFTSESIGRETKNYLNAPQNLMIKKALTNVSIAEKRVLTLLTQSLTSREIAERLNLSIRTVQAHRTSLAEKLDAKGHNKLLELAITHRKAILGL